MNWQGIIKLAGSVGDGEEKAFCNLFSRTRVLSFVRAWKNSLSTNSLSFTDDVTLRLLVHRNNGYLVFLKNSETSSLISIVVCAGTSNHGDEVLIEARVHSRFTRLRTYLDAVHNSRLWFTRI